MAHEGLARDVHHFLVVVAAGGEAGEERAHARSPDNVDRDAQLAQRTQQADMGEAARTTATEHQADATTGQLAREAGKVVAVVTAHEVMGTRADLLAPAEQPAST